MRGSPLESFLYRAHRRWTVCLVMEHAAIGLLLGCGAALPLILILLYRGGDARSIAIALPMLGVAAGAMSGFRRRPTPLAAAMLADARLGTADLLGTAWTLRSSTDAWHTAIISLADAHCLGLSPAILTPRLLSARAWAGVALAASCVLTLGLMSNIAPLTRAQTSFQPDAPDVAIGTVSTTVTPPPSNLPQFTPQREARADPTPDSRAVPGDEEMQSAAGTKVTGDADSPHRTDTASDGAGAGSARTNTSVGRSPNDSTASNENRPPSAAVSAGGSGAAEQRPLHSGRPSFGTVASSNSAPAPLWSSATWPADRAAALEAVRSGDVPDAYREMVRDYFDQK